MESHPIYFQANRRWLMSWSKASALFLLSSFVLSSAVTPVILWTKPITARHIHSWVHTFTPTCLNSRPGQRNLHVACKETKGNQIKTCTEVDVLQFDSYLCFSSSIQTVSVVIDSSSLLQREHTKQNQRKSFVQRCSTESSWVLVLASWSGFLLGT